MKNVVWWAGVKTGEFKEKYGGHNWIDISRKSWEFWCKRNDVLFVPLEEPIEEDVRKYRINWQKSIFVFDELERRGIDYNQICLVDASSIIRWDAPNFFNLTEGKFSAVRETDNMHWMLQSVEGYEPFFNFKLDTIKYFSSGFLVFNREHRKMFNSFKQLYIDNVDEFVKMQDETVGKGTEQTPLNYWVQKNNVEVNLLPPTWKLTHIQRKEMFSHNWQLQEDTRQFFMKYGYIWFFTGIAKDQRSNIMNQVWNAYQHFYSEDYVLNQVSGKHQAKYTTSSRFKEDLLHYFSHPNCKKMTVLELGSCRGDTTRILSECFGKVISFELNPDNVKEARELNKDRSNVTITQADVYSNEFSLPNETIHVAFVDAGHTTERVLYDINRISEKYGKIIYIFDDFGQVDEVIKKAIYQAQSEGKLTIARYIGENAGFVTANGKKFKTAEGIICNI